MTNQNDTAYRPPANGQGRTPPHNLDAEKALLGAQLLTPKAIEAAQATIRPVDYYHPGHGLIAEAIAEIHEAGDQPDPVSVAEVLRAKGVLERVGGPAFLLKLQADCPATSNAGRYAAIIKGHADRRRAIHLAGEIAEMAYEQAMAAPDVATEALKLVQALVDATNSELRIFNMAQLVNEHADLLEQRGEGLAVGLTYGYPDLDDMTGGMREGELVLVIAEPAVGKSAFVGNVARRVGAGGTDVLLVSVEMARMELMDRLLAAQARLPLSMLRDGNLGQSALERAAAAQHQLLHSNVHIVDDPDITLEQIDAAVRRTRAGLVVVDYAQILRAPEGTQSREREVAAISSGLKRMARRHRIPVMVLSAINRNVAGRADQRPVRTDIRESGQLEYDSNVVLGLYRDELKNPDTEHPGVMEVIVLKSRNSGAGTVRLRYDPDTQLIS